MRPLYKYISILFFTFTSIGLNAQVNFHVSVYPEVIHKDELVTYKIVIENSNDLQQISPPPFNDFILVSGPNEESGYTRMNGVMNHYLALTFILKPRRTGNLKIGRSEITVAGKSIRSSALKLMVKNSLSGSGSNLSSLYPQVEQSRQRSAFSPNDYILKKGDNVTEKVKRNMQLKLILDKKKCYVGEPVVASYKLYSRLKSDSRLMQNPSFNGFSVVDLQAPDVTTFENEKINGKDFNVYTIRKAQLYPLQPGTIQVESAELENKVQFINEGSRFAEREDLIERFDAFGGSAFISSGDITNVIVNLVSTPENIEVMPLPEINKPANFKGAVGNFAIKSELRSDKFTCEQAGNLVITISGSGNLQLITSPEITWPEHLESFEPKSTDDLIFTSVPVSGKRKFEYIFSVDTAGNYVIPEIQFSYFDPELEIYKMVKTLPINFSVASVPVSDKTIKFSDTVEKISWLNKLPDNKKIIAGIVAGLILTGIIFYAISSRKRIDKETGDVEMSVAEAIPHVCYSNKQNPLEYSEKCINANEGNRFYATLHSDIRNFLADKLRLTPQEINSRSIDNYFEKQNIPNEYALELQQLLHEIEWQLYTPVEGSEEMHVIYNKAQSLIQSINMYCISSQ